MRKEIESIEFVCTYVPLVRDSCSTRCRKSEGWCPSRWWAGPRWWRRTWESGPYHSPIVWAPISVTASTSVRPICVWKTLLMELRPSWADGKRVDGTGHVTASMRPYWYCRAMPPADAMLIDSHPIIAQKSARLMVSQYCWKMGSKSSSTMVLVTLPKGISPAFSAVLLRQPSGPSLSACVMSISPA